MTTTVAIIAAGLLMPATTQDTDLTRKFEKGEQTKYSFSIIFEAGEGNIEAAGTVATTVKELKEKGRALIEMSATDLAFLMGGSDMGIPVPEPQSLDFGPNGVPNSLNVDDDGFIYALTVVGAFVPAKSVKAGDTFEINWKAAGYEGDVVVQGRGKFVGISEFESEKAAKLELEFSLTPGEDEPGHFKLETLVALSNGKLLKANGTLEVEGEGSGKITVVRTK